MDGKVMNNVRSGIIEDILNRSSVVDTKTGSLVIQPKKLMAELKTLGDDPHLKMFFTPENLSTLGKFELYTNVIGASSDFGGQLAAAEIGTEVTKSILDPSKILPTLKTIMDKVEEGPDEQRPADKEVQRLIKAEAKLRERMIKLEQIFLRDARPENVKLSKDLQKIYKETVTKFMREMIKIRKKLK